MTASIRQRTETLQELYLRYFSDRRIATLNNEIAAIYNVAIPKFVVALDEKTITVIYDEKVQNEVQQCRNIIAEIIKTEYQELQYDETKTHTQENK